jgi:long-chain acyl-CoA synthetase
MAANIHQMLASLPKDFEQKPIDLLKKPGPENIFCLHPLPFYHVYGLISCLLTCAGGGAGTLTLPNPREIHKLIPLMNRADVGLMTAINTLLKGILTHPALSSLRLPSDFIVIVGGMATSPDVGRDWFDKTGTRITEGFGLTEASPLVSLVDPKNPKCGLAGYPLPSTLVKLRDEHGNDLPLGAGPEVRGELLIKGPQRMLEYYQNPSETEKMISEDGFLLTGDIATLAEDGMIEIVDRKKDMIIVSGFNVYPNEVEARALETRMLIECAAIGRPDAKTGERVVLYAVPQDPRLDPIAFGEILKNSLTNYKRPSEIIFVKELPKSAVGKILRREVRELAKKMDQAS